MTAPGATARLRAMLDAARRIVVFTGAGISTESGIPDFRSPGCIWSRLKPIEFQDYLASEAMRREAWRRKMEIDRDMRNATPNRGHRAVAELVRRGKTLCVVTQNIDGLHQRSGIPDSHLVELHGNATYATCLDCSARYEIEPILDAFIREDVLPVCARCDGIIKTATISFGQPMPAEPMRRAHAATLACDLFLVLGSSLLVYPAAGFPALAKRNGAALAIINREPTDLDASADLVLHEPLGPTLGSAIEID